MLAETIQRLARYVSAQHTWENGEPVRYDLTGRFKMERNLHEFFGNLTTVSFDGCIMGNTTRKRAPAHEFTAGSAVIDSTLNSAYKLLEPLHYDVNYHEPKQAHEIRIVRVDPSKEMEREILEIEAMFGEPRKKIYDVFPENASVNLGVIIDQIWSPD